MSHRTTGGCARCITQAEARNLTHRGSRSTTDAQRPARYREAEVQAPEIPSDCLPSIGEALQRLAPPKPSSSSTSNVTETRRRRVRCKEARIQARRMPAALTDNCPLGRLPRPSPPPTPPRRVRSSAWPAWPARSSARSFRAWWRRTGWPITPTPATMPARGAIEPAEIEGFTRLVMADATSRALAAAMDGAAHAAARLEAIYLDLLAPAARQLGELWDEDLCDFTDGDGRPRAPAALDARTEPGLRDRGGAPAQRTARPAGARAGRAAHLRSVDGGRVLSPCRLGGRRRGRGRGHRPDHGGAARMVRRGRLLGGQRSAARLVARLHRGSAQRLVQPGSADPGRRAGVLRSSPQLADRSVRTRTAAGWAARRLPWPRACLAGRVKRC